MSSALIHAIKNEISELEQSLEIDIRSIRIRELRKILDLYRNETETYVAEKPQFSLSQPPACKEPALSVAESSRPAAGGRKPSPEREQALAIVRQLLSGKMTPTPTREIFAYIENEGASVPGEAPINNLSAMLSNSDAFVSHGRSGWTLAETELRKIASVIPDELTDAQRKEALSSWDAGHTFPAQTADLLSAKAREVMGRVPSNDELDQLHRDAVDSLRGNAFGQDKGEEN